MRLACLHNFFHAVHLDFNENLDGKLHTFIRSFTLYPDFLEPSTFLFSPYLKELILKRLFCALLQRENWKINSRGWADENEVIIKHAINWLRWVVDNSHFSVHQHVVRKFFAIANLKQKTANLSSQKMNRSRQMSTSIHSKSSSKFHSKFIHSEIFLHFFSHFLT